MARRRKGTGQFPIERDLIRSPAYLSLTGRAPQVLTVFLSKAVFQHVNLPGHRGKQWRQINNGEIKFTYSEAADLGVPQGVFRRAIDQLVEHGFIDIDRPGGGMHGSATLYALSTRWRAWGKPDFTPAKRARDKRRIGFQAKQIQRAQTHAGPRAQTHAAQKYPRAQTHVEEIRPNLPQGTPQTEDTPDSKPESPEMKAACTNARTILISHRDGGRKSSSRALETVHQKRERLWTLQQRKAHTPEIDAEITQLTRELLAAESFDLANPNLDVEHVHEE